MHTHLHMFSKSVILTRAGAGVALKPVFRAVMFFRNPHTLQPHLHPHPGAPTPTTNGPSWCSGDILTNGNLSYSTHVLVLDLLHLNESPSRWKCASQMGWSEPIPGWHPARLLQPGIFSLLSCARPPRRMRRRS